MGPGALVSFTGVTVNYNGTTPDVNGSSSGAETHLVNGSTLNIATGKTFSSLNNTLSTDGNNNTINVYGTLMSGRGAFITGGSSRSGQTKFTTINLFSGSSVFGSSAAIEPVGESNFTLNANGTSIGNNESAYGGIVPAIWVIGNGGYGPSNDGKYTLNDTKITSNVAAMAIDYGNNNVVEFSGSSNTVVPKYVFRLTGGTNNTFIAGGASILQSTGGTAIATAYASLSNGASNFSATDVNNFIFKGSAQIIGGNGRSFEGGKGQDILTLSESATLQGDVLTGAGDDKFTMSGGSLVGKLDMDTGNDTATFINQTDASTSSISAINGGLGTPTR